MRDFTSLDERAASQAHRRFSGFQRPRAAIGTALILLQRVRCSRPGPDRHTTHKGYSPITHCGNRRWRTART